MASLKEILVAGLVMAQFFIALNGVSGLAIKPDNVQKKFDPLLRLPDPDGLFHFYVLPIGQGETSMLQCPNGDLSILDLGAGASEPGRYWGANEVRTFLSGQLDRIINIIITHNHADHYSFFPSVLATAADVPNLNNIYISCDYGGMDTNTQNWVNNIGAFNKIRQFNGGLPCGPLRPLCGDLNLCPGDPSVQVKVLAANLENCINMNKNLDSIVFKVIHNGVTIMFNGDFEDATTSQDENGVQKAMVDFYGDELKVTAYKLARHGAQTLANKIISCHAHAPKAVFVSATTWNLNWRDPRCDVLDRFILDVGTLCKPLETNPASPFYCGVHPDATATPDEKQQRVYTCGLNSTEVNGGFREIDNNEFAIYSTTPDANRLNVIKFSSDGVRWGFTNNFTPVISTN